MNANLYVKFDLTKEDINRINEAISVMNEIKDDIAKCYGHYYGYIDKAVDELKTILNGEVI